ncbi:DinB family protein [Nocardioides marmorisolisilvae]|uniref:DinB family protein n=1 Tax=Nocardioides marmorisolisilvae TaxID=1542737 RepID=A0A3N0DRR9_9ACTN|nr:DinB family protein [Nocardioides marmorisolisilvae]RNL78325.1 DinB family protein [Nocardioides marmorisolisilvae]
MTDLKAELHEKLQVTRGVMVAKLEGLSEYDARRPITASGTNLLGLVKHLVGCEEVYLGTSFGRPPSFAPLPWVADNSVWENADMWVRPEESRAYILDLYDQACRHGDATIEALDLDAPGSVPHWPEERRATDLGTLLIRMVDETAHHAGHADILREIIDNAPGQGDAEEIGDATYWSDYVATIQAAAETFR